MPLTKLENLISSKTGRYLYVSPDDFNASDALDNRGNSPTRPFLTIQRAFLEVGRYSYVPGQENDRFDQFTIMLSPGNHYIDNRPGILNPEEIAPFAYNQATQEWEDESIVDLGNPNNILYKFNGPNGGATIPRGTSLVGMDLRRTRLHPLYVPDPADSDIGRTTLFNVTGGCYFWQFTILDGDVEPNSPLYDTTERIGKVYAQPNSTLTTIPYYSHHKICNFEFASRDDLGLLYRKIARAFSQFQPTIDDPGEFEQRPQENRIVGPLQDAIRIDSIEVNDVAGTSALDVTVKTKTNHGYYVGQSVAMASLRSTLPAGASQPIPLSNDPLTGVFSVREISITDPKEFTYRVIGKTAAGVGLGDKIGTSITPPDLDTNASTQAEIDSVESASPYVFNVSIRSTWGICGIHADGSKATGFKSMVIAQYTGVSLQRDDRAFIRYDEFSNTWNQAPLTDAFATTPYHTKGDAYWKDDWRNFHVKASNDAFIQNVSIFAVGFADHFLMESGGDMSITNSNSNFGNTSLHAIGYKGYAFSQDQGGYISHIVPPKKVTTTTKKYQYFTFDQIKIRGSSSLDTTGPVNVVRLYIGTDEASDPLQKPATTVNGYRLGAQSHEKIYVKLDPATGFTGSIREAEVSPAGYRKYDVALSILSPSVNSAVISNKDQDAANLIDINRDFIASETYGYITRKFPYLLTREGISIEKCRRDVGYVLEAVANDLRVGGNVNSVQAGQAYYTGNNLDFIDGEKEESLDAFAYARNLAVAAMRNWNFKIENCSTTLNGSVVTVPAAYTTIGLVEGMAVTATPATGQNNPIPSGTFVQEIISTTQFRLGNSSDTDTVNATATITAQGFSGGITLNFELNQAKFASSSGRGLDAGNLIKANKDFIAEEALILAKQWDPATNVPDDTKCKRDIKLILDGVIQDLATFGNSGIVDAATSYVGAADRFFDGKNLILSNRREIIDKAAAKLAIEYPDFYYGGSGFSNGGDAQTNVYGRYKDAYRLIQQNKQHIQDKAVAEVAIAHPDFYFPGDSQTDTGARFADGYRLIQQNKNEIVQSAYDEILIQHPGFVNPSPASCIRDLTIFVDSVSLDLFQGGNRYTRLFTLEYFNGPGAGSLNGEETQTITAYNKATEMMKAAVTNQLTIKDLSITADTVTGDNQSPLSCSNVRINIDNLNSIVVTALTNGNTNALPNESSGSIVTDGESKCKRDVGMFIDAVSTDLTTLGNSYSIDFAKQYFVEGNVNGKVLTFTKTAGTTLLSRADRIYNGVETTAVGATGGGAHTWAGGVASGAVISGGNYTHTFVSAAAGAISSGGNYAHTFVSATTNGVTADSGNLPNPVTDVAYDPATGDMVITSPGHGLTNSNTITIANNALTFTCAMDNNGSNHSYPRATDPASGTTLPISSVTTDTFTVNVSASPIVQFNVTDADYNATSGLLELTIGNHSLTAGTSVQIADNSLTFTCLMDGNSSNKTYPRASDPSYQTAVNITAVTATTITLDVGASPIVNHNVSDATYDANTGDLVLNIGNHSLSTNTSIRLAPNSLTFTCDKDNNSSLHTYPRLSDPAYNTALNISAVTADTITVNVGVDLTNGDTGSGATFRVTRDSNGAIDTVTIIDGGYGYRASDIITIPGSKIGGVNIADDVTVTIDSVETAWIVDGLQGEESPSITAFNSAIETMKLAFDNQLFVKDLTITGDPQPGNAGSGISVFGTPGTTTNNQDTQSCSNVQATLDTLSSIIFARIRQGDMVTGTATNPAVPEINYGSAPSFQEKCKRDIGIVVDAIAEDLGLGGNYNIINATLSYFDSTGNTLINNGLAGELAQSITAFAEARDLCFKAVTNQLNVRDFDITSGPGEIGVAGPNIPNDNPNACLDVRNTLDSLFAILIDKLNNSALALPATTYNAGAYSLAGELNISVYAYKKARDLAILAMRNWRTGDGLATDPLYVKDPTNTLNYNLDLTIDTSTAGVPVCADVAYTIATEFDILIDALESTGPLPPRNSGSDEYVVRYSPVKDTSITVDTGADKCAGTKDAIIEKMRVIDSIIRNGVDAEPLVSQLVNTSDFATRATLFRVGGANPHNMETGTPVRLVPKAANENVDKRLVRLPRGFETNTRYYVIAPGKITQPNNYSAGGATAQFNDSQTFMLATSLENATAGNYIYSSETATISPDINIEVHQYLTDVNYDLHRYTCELVSSRVFETTTNHVFDTAINGVQVQQVFFYPLEENLVNGEAVGAALDTLPTKTTGDRLEIDRPYYVGRPATYTKNNEFSLYLTVQNAIDKQNAVQFNFPSGQSFHVFATKKRSPLGYDAAQQCWYIKSLQSGNEIYERITMADASRGSLYVNKPPRTPDSFFYRADDTREKEDKSYKLRYVIPNYRDDVRDPLEGFAIRLRTDEKRKLLPQKLLLKPVASGVQKDATFFEEGPSPRERLGVSAALTEYDPYNPIFAKRIEGTKTESNVSFTIQSARTNSDGYLEMTVFDHGLDLESLKAERFVTLKVGQPQGGNGDFVEGSTVTWYGDYEGSATVHAWFGSENVEGGLQEFNYLILKGVQGQLDFADNKQTFIRQAIAGQADVTAEVLDRPNFGKEDKDEYLYGVEASNVYCITPGDVVTDDAARQYRIVSVEDVSDLTETYYVYSIEEIQRRIPRQQDGVYYLTVVRGDISPLPLGSGIGQNFRNFKFSQPVSRLYPLTYKNDPLLFQYDGSDEQGGNQDTTLLDPPAASCAADNYIHGLVSINDAKNSATKEMVLDFIDNPGSGDYTYTGANEIKAQTGAASSGAEERLIPIAGDSAFPLEQKLFIELRRPSIARAGNHTFEYLGFGPGNYSTGFPVRQTVILTDVQDYYAQSKRQDAGIVFYTGINSNGELYIGNRKINAITGEEEFLDALILEEDDQEDGEFGSLVTVFEDPVTFENIITLNAPPNLTNFFNSPITVNVDPEFEAKMTPPSIRVVSRPGDRQGVVPGDDDPRLDTTRAGDILIDKNRVRAAIFDLNPRGTQRYTLRSGIDNMTPNQDTSGTKARFNASQTIKFGSSVPLSGDILFKGGEVGFTGSLGWVYSNSYVPYTLKVAPGNESALDITGVEFYPNLNVVKLIFQTGKVNFSSSNPGASLGITLISQIKITGAIDTLATLNGVHTVYNNAAEGYEYLESNSYVYVITERASETLLVGNGPYIYSVNSNSTQPTIEIALGESQWKETGVIGAEALRTETSVYGDYKLGVNTVARAQSSDYTDGFNSTATYPRANLDVVGTTYISGRTQTTLSDGTGGTPVASNYALLVGGDSANEDSTAEFRIATTTLSQAGRTEGATADIDNGRVGINVNDAALDKNFVVSGDARITGDFTFESDIDVDGGDIRSTSTNFAIANQSTTTGLTIAGYAQNIQLGDLATGFQNIDIGTASTAATTLDVHTSSTDSIINLGTVANNNTAYKSKITVGGAYTNNQDSFFNIKNFQTIVDGVLTINGGEINTTSPTGEFKMFESGLTKLQIGLSVGTLEIGGVAGTSKIRNGLHVLGSSLFESDITQNGGLKNTNLGIERNVFGLIAVATVTRASNVATITTTDVHGLTTGNLVEIETSFNSFNPTGTVSVTVTGTNSFTYTNTGSDVATTVATGTVIRDNVGVSQAVGSLANLNIDYFSVVKNLDDLQDISTVSSNKLIIASSPFSANDAIIFFDVGNLTGVSTGTTYYVDARDSAGFTLKDSNDVSVTIGLATGTTDAGTARVQLQATRIDTVGDVPWGDASFKTGATTTDGDEIYELPINNPEGVSLNQLLLIDAEIVKTVDYPTSLVPDAPVPYSVQVIRAQRGTSAAAHEDASRIFRLVEQQNASYVFPSPLTATDQTINVAEFSANIQVGDLFRLNKTDLDTGGEYVKISVINPADAQTFTINNGDFGNTAAPKDPLQVFKVISTTGQTQVTGDVVIGYDTAKPFINATNDQAFADATGKQSSTATGSTLQTTGGGNLTVHNSIELSGNTDTTTPAKQYFVITNGTLPKFYVESASGDTKLYNGADFKIFKDSFFSTGNFDKSRTDAATNIALEVLGASGNTKVAGTLRAGDDLTVGTLANSANAETSSNAFTTRFSVDAQLGSTVVGKPLTSAETGATLTVHGTYTATGSAATNYFSVNNLGNNNAKPFRIRGDASIEAFGHENFYNKNGGRKTVFISTQGNNDSSAVELAPNLQYLVRPSSTLVLRLPDYAITGDVIRIVDVGGALNFNINLVIRAPLGTKVQGGATGSSLGGASNYGGGELVVNTPNAGFGLIYVGDTDAAGNGIAGEQQGWFLMEI